MKQHPNPGLFNKKVFKWVTRFSSNVFAFVTFAVLRATMQWWRFRFCFMGTRFLYWLDHHTRDVGNQPSKYITQQHHIYQLHCVENVVLLGSHYVTWWVVKPDEWWNLIYNVEGLDSWSVMLVAIPHISYILFIIVLMLILSSLPLTESRPKYKFQGDDGVEVRNSQASHRLSPRASSWHISVS